LVVIRLVQLQESKEEEIKNDANGQKEKRHKMAEHINRAELQVPFIRDSFVITLMTTDGLAVHIRRPISTISTVCIAAASSQY
jgi:hypothetical protein